MKHYDFDDLEIKEETEEQKRFRKIAKIAITGILLFTVLGFIIPHDVLNSIIESRTVKENQISKNNSTFYFKPAVLDELQTYYKTHQTAEFKLCLEGYVRGGSYYITSFYEPKIYFNNPLTVHSAICNESTIIDLHSHSLKNCLFSEQDIISYRILNRQTIGAVMCDVDRFNFYNN